MHINIIRWLLHNTFLLKKQLFHWILNLNFHNFHNYFQNFLQNFQNNIILFKIFEKYYKTKFHFLSFIWFIIDFFYLFRNVFLNRYFIELNFHLLYILINLNCFIFSFYLINLINLIFYIHYFYLTLFLKYLLKY